MHVVRAASKLNGRRYAMRPMRRRTPDVIGPNGMTVQTGRNATEALRAALGAE